MADLFSAFEDESSALTAASLPSLKRSIPNIEPGSEQVTKKSKATEPESNNDDPIVVSAPVPEQRRKVLVQQVVNTRKEGDEEVTCSHEVALPEGWQEPPPPATIKKPARVYPFTLDPFQRESIECLEKGQSVLVSAHTSAGKTVVAEYAIALCLRDAQRVVYTSPIKALSNQKYRDLCEEFGDVGLMTGDVTINPNASCIVMTTEILRSMLYRGSEMIREIAWVVFDEVHYMRDRERGVVWEESIIMMPNRVRFVFLSATIPNAIEFAEWICSIHNQPCHVVYTDYRPTPLQHYIFPAGGDGLHLVVDDKRRFRDDAFQKALSALGDNKEEPSGGGGGGRNKQQGKGSKSDIFRIVKLIMSRHYDPCLLFCFSKRDCEAHALQMSKMDLNTDEEKKLVEEVFTNAIDSLGEDDKKLPQVENILPLLKRGIGLHHSGLLPILKEVVEILFQEGLIKALFSTETFSIGLNMPAKTVVFTSVRKFDGQQFRWVSGGEYIQMSGRAGRRGIDDRGIVILMVDEKMEPAVAKSMLKGNADQLNSTFHLGYNMLLNLMRTEEADPEHMIRHSFHQFQADRALPDMKSTLDDLKKEYDGIAISNESSVAEYYDLRHQLAKLKEEMRTIINKPEHALPFLQPGRLIRVRDGDVDWGWGVVFNFQKKPIADKATPSLDGPAFVYYVDALLHCSTEEGKPKPASADEKGEMKVIPLALNVLDGASSLRVYLPHDLRPANNRQAVLKSVKEIQRRFPDGLPLLDPIEDMHITDSTFKALVRKVESLEDRLFSHPLFNDSTVVDLIAKYDRKMQLQTEMKVVQRQIKAASDLCLREELKCMRRLLRRLGYTNSDNVIQMKGRVACEISAADEILVTELIFNGVFNEMPVETCVAMLSALVCDEKDKNLQLTADMQKTYAILTDTARSLAKVMAECKIEIDPEEYVESFKPSVMDVVFLWCKGAKFVDVCKTTDMFEGNIIRVMRRLEELLRQVAAAAKAIGNVDLESKFAKGIELLRRDIVFASSLYL
eukprot:c9683_g2_i1.p1 GENE.c9683_g2_i1~~c9683_g2_i1.p1  ORF type:complete len:1032 (-),score=263.71 c9683_g2_i1:80-3130(-)